MPVQTTSRLALPWPDGNDDVSNGDNVIRQLAEKADNLVPYSQGTLASRPVSTNGTPGIVGRRYYAIDAGVEYLDTGTDWLPVATPQVVLPVGGMIDYAGLTEPAGGSLLFPDGRPLVRADYTELFAAIGTRYGAPSGTTFSLPDLRGRSTFAPNDMGTQGTATGNTRILGASGTQAGERDTTLSISQMPAHSHGVTDPGHQHNTGSGDGGGGLYDENAGATTGNGAQQSGQVVGYANNNGTGKGIATTNTGSAFINLFAKLSKTNITISSNGSGGAHNSVHPVVAVGKLIRVR